MNLMVHNLNRKYLARELQSSLLLEKDETYIHHTHTHLLSSVSLRSFDFRGL